MADLVSVATRVMAITTVLIAVGAVTVIGSGQIRAAVRSFRARGTSVAPYALALGLVLAVNKGTQATLQDLSWSVGFNATPYIQALEGEFVGWLQAASPRWLLLYFSAVYVIGYSVLLTFPPVAYFCSRSMDSLKRLLVAYGVNYSIGVLLYTLVVAYGPRNVMPTVVGQPLYELFPESMLLTSAVNTNTNVFPSLHTSLSVTVLLFALGSRSEYPRWTPIAAVLATSVTVSTMALGIHWLTDVIVGVMLGVASVRVSGPLVDRIEAALAGSRFRRWFPETTA